MKFDLTPFLQNALKRLGGWYLPAAVLAVQLIAFLSTAVATYLVQNNARFSADQIAMTIRITWVLVPIGNVIMASWAYYTSQNAFLRLNLWSQGRPLPSGEKTESAAWREVNSLPLRFILTTFLVALIGETIPLLVFLYFYHGITAEQFQYGIMGGLVASFGGSALASHILDYLMRPVRKVLLPDAIEVQLKYVSSFGLSNKIIGSAVTLIVIGILVMGPIGYHHVIQATSGGASGAEVVNSFRVEAIAASFINLVLGLVLSILILRTLLTPMRNLIQAMQALEQGNLTKRVDVIASDEIGEVSIYFNHMARRLNVLQDTLETQVKERTAQLRATVQVSRAISAILDADELTERLVNLIAEEFGYYYVALFLLDPSEHWAELRNATGDAGRVLRENKHRLEVDGKNMVGTAIREHQPQVVMDTVGNHVRFDNPLLPYTRSEIALPLIVGDRVLGALDAQSTKESAFGEEDIETLQTMANQIAIALENARLFQEAQQNLRDMHAIQQQYLLNTWKRVTDEQPNLSYENGELEPHETVRQIEIPLSLRDQIIGQINLTGDNDWTPEERSMIEAIASQAALALENARLVEDSQSTARRERMVAEITSKIWSSSTIDGIMQTAAREMGRALDTDEVTIELKAD
ncbi:MAG: GAF domain-containing protein [Chloroflexi bacterium]|nr:GAF domain-containing protein [Chloroflexota bacterium]